jgi:ATP dependent DNA ligase domain
MPSSARRPPLSAPPKWIKPQLTRLVDEAPTGDGWLHEFKYDGYRMHARLDRGHIQLLTRTGLDWSHHYQGTIHALSALPVTTAYLDGELCAIRPDGVPAFSRLQAAMDEGRTDELILFVFDLLDLDGESTAALPLIERKERLRGLFAGEMPGLRFSDYVIGGGPRSGRYLCITSCRRSSGSAWMVRRSRPDIVSAMHIALRIASSVASAAAWKRLVIASGASIFTLLILSFWPM